MTSLQPHDLRGTIPGSGVNSATDLLIQDLSRALGYIEATAANALRRRTGLGEALQQIRDIARAAAAPRRVVTGDPPAGVAGYPVGTRHPQDPNEGVGDAP